MQHRYKKEDSARLHTCMNVRAEPHFPCSFKTAFSRSGCEIRGKLVEVLHISSVKVKPHTDCMHFTGLRIQRVFFVFLDDLSTLWHPVNSLQIRLCSSFTDERLHNNTN